MSQEACAVQKTFSWSHYFAFHFTLSISTHVRKKNSYFLKSISAPFPINNLFYFLPRLLSFASFVLTCKDTYFKTCESEFTRFRNLCQLIQWTLYLPMSFILTRCLLRVSTNTDNLKDLILAASKFRQLCSLM